MNPPRPPKHLRRVFAIAVVATAGLAGCNPHAGEPLPAARCRNDRDCRATGALCRSGRCELHGFVEGRLHFARPSKASWGKLRLVALRGGLRGGRRGFVDTERVHGRQTRRSVRYAFRLEGLPTGLVQLLALCGDGRGRIAGRTEVVIGKSGRASVLGSRSSEVPLFVDRSRCRRASLH